jgi:negative regulator of flagellin synthesis FlgM
MRISDEQVKKVLSQSSTGRFQDAGLDLEPSPKPTDGPMIEEVTKAVVNMPDREDRIAEVKAMLASGTYNPSGDDIADAMIRRSIADRVR